MRPYATDNFSLAMTLLTLGVPPADQNCPEWREIREEDLEKNGWETVEDAEDAGFEGTIVYGSAEHPERATIIRSFNTAHHAPSASVEIPDTLEIVVAGGKKQTVKFVQILATFAAILFKNRKKFADRRKKVKAKLRLTKGDGFAVLDRRSSAEEKERFSK